MHYRRRCDAGNKAALPHPILNNSAEIGRPPLFNMQELLDYRVTLSLEEEFINNEKMFGRSLNLVGNSSKESVEPVTRRRGRFIGIAWGLYRRKARSHIFDDGGNQTFFRWKMIHQCRMI